MTDQEWRQAADGQWYPVNGPKSKVSTGAIIAVAAVAWALIALLVLVSWLGDDAPTTPSAESRTEDALNELWLGMDTGERLDFCAEARAAGYEVVANEIAGVRLSEPREVRWWLEDRCG